MKWSIESKDLFNLCKNELKKELQPLLNKHHCLLIKTGSARWLIVRSNLQTSPYYYELYHQPIGSRDFHKQHGHAGHKYAWFDGENSVLFALQFIESHDRKKLDGCIDIEILPFNYERAREKVFKMKWHIPNLNFEQALTRYKNEHEKEIKEKIYFIEGFKSQGLHYSHLERDLSRIKEEYKSNIQTCECLTNSQPRWYIEDIKGYCYVKKCKNCKKLVSS